MSAIALKWVSELCVGNATAKHLLLFYASHNFNSPNYEFKNSTLARHLEVTERAIRNAHKFLLMRGFITKDERFDKNGRQLSNSFTLNIPKEFVDNYLGEGEARSPLGRNYVPPQEELRSPLVNNNNINNKTNNKERASAEKRPRPHPLSDDFVPSMAIKEMAEKRRIDLESSFRKFVIHAKNKKWLFLDHEWEQQLEKWVLSEKVFESKQKSLPKQEKIHADVNSQSTAWVSPAEAIKRDREYWSKHVC